MISDRIAELKAIIAPTIDVVDVDEERRKSELWMRFFEAWLGVPRERIIYDGEPLP